MILSNPLSIARTFIVLTGLALSACSQVQYRAEGDAAPSSELPFDRTVSFKLSRAFYETPPRCAFVLPLQGKAANTKPGQQIEDAAARQLSQRIERVMSPRRRDRLMRELAIDPTTAKGRARFATATRCSTAVEIVSTGLESTYALVWAHAKLQLAMRLVRARDGKELWRAEHATTRSEGTVPLSPISIPVGAFSAGRFQGDEDKFPSMADDAARRIVASLPDMRGAFRQRRRP